MGLASKTAHDMMSAEPWTPALEGAYQIAGVAMVSNAAKDMAWSVRAVSTKADKRDACKLAGWSWLAGSVLHATATANGKSRDSDLAWAASAGMGLLAATLLAKGYNLDEEARTSDDSCSAPGPSAAR